MSEKRVLIELNQNRKQVVFDASTGVSDVIVLKNAIKSSFGIELNESQDLLVQRKNEEWGGLWVDVEENEEVRYDRSLMKEPSAKVPASRVSFVGTPVGTTNSEAAARVTNVFCSPGIQAEKLLNLIEMEIFDTVDKNLITEKAKIYTSDNLTNYQKQVNAASVELCLQNPALLLGKKGDLMTMAREKVHEDGYAYKKGKSRAKRANCSSACSDGTSSEDSVAVKRPKIDGHERQLRIDHLIEQITDIEKRITYKQRRIDTAAAMKNYKACDELSQEMSELKTQKHELNCLLGPLQKKAAKSAWYYKSKQKKTQVRIDANDADISDNIVSDTSRENSVESNIDQSFLQQSLPTEEQQQ